MKKEYIMPSIEIIASQLNSEMMAGHSDDWADAKENNMFLFDDEEFDEENDLWGEKPNADKYDLWND